jgi:diphthamide synthase (EF-2-diphthine--ammonia ligase)
MRIARIMMHVTGEYSLMNIVPNGNFIGSNDEKPVLMSWSGGKDSCLALYEIPKSSNHRVAALLTTITREYDRISMHGVRRVLLERQAASLGLPLHQVLIRRAQTTKSMRWRWLKRLC